MYTHRAWPQQSAAWVPTNTLAVTQEHLKKHKHLKKYKYLNNLLLHCCSMKVLDSAAKLLHGTIIYMAALLFLRKPSHSFLPVLLCWIFWMLTTLRTTSAWMLNLLRLRWQHLHNHGVWGKHSFSFLLYIFSELITGLLGTKWK